MTQKLLPLPLRLALFAAGFALTAGAHANADVFRSANAAKTYDSAYKEAKGHKAFAQSGLGAWGWGSDPASVDAAREAAIKACSQHLREDEPPCVVFDVDGDEVKTAAEEERVITNQFADRYLDTLMAAALPADRAKFNRAASLLNRLVRPSYAVKSRTARAYNAGISKMKEGDIKNALEALDRASEGNAGVFQVQYLRGMALAILGRPADADVALRRSLQLDLGNPDAWMYEALVLYNLGQLEKSQAALITAYQLARTPGRPVGLYQPKRLDKLEVQALLHRTADKEKNPDYKKVVEAALVEIDRRAALRTAASAPPESSPLDGVAPVREAGAPPCEKPLYPLSARQRQAQGNVTLAYLFDKEGKVVDSVLTQSSGYDDLDTSAVYSLSKCKFAFPKSAPQDARFWSSIQFVYRIEE